MRFWIMNRTLPTSVAASIYIASLQSALKIYQMYHITETQTKDLPWVSSERPLSLLGTELFCASVFSFAVPSAAKTLVLQSSAEFGSSPAQ